ncbi:hypothetical protein [Rickettsiales endosymbiont of Stachyamoeba lipophora]|uniref:hypothetical protein n=1 Tax=Rickettsiales endosymbiont of Stachyamoeba lipophora TaxID=2486578 RepID=UPI000F651DA6|nr:hypothetical protein [Rickettsiales endosymbiont of Stachyamoeba lipophora]AZL15448.1 hypothetical protein EF513_02625 [Rickettsiales endosymbiont of Stachyamoeba lipophora]
MFYTQQIHNFNSEVFSAYCNSSAEFIKIFQEKYLNIFDFNNNLKSSDMQFALQIKNNFKNFIIVGMGGAILNPRMIASNYYPQSLENVSNLIFIDYLDEAEINKQLAKIELNNTFVLVISKTGNTIETCVITDYLVNKFENQAQRILDHFAFITTHDSKIGNIAKEYKSNILVHPEVGGRFSSLTKVGLIPGILKGFEADKVIKSAKSSLERFLSNPQDHNSFRSAIFLYHTHANQILMSYSLSCLDFAGWYAQILAESLGKKRQGITPILSLCPTDYHSQMQLYLDGPQDKTFNLIANESVFESGLGKIAKGQFNALTRFLNQHDTAYRIISLPIINEDVLGEIITDRIIEVLFLSFLKKINPLGQPIVDELKSLIGY